MSWVAFGSLILLAVGAALIATSTLQIDGVHEILGVNTKYFTIIFGAASCAIMGVGLIYFLIWQSRMPDPDADYPYERVGDLLGDSDEDA